MAGTMRAAWCGHARRAFADGKRLQGAHAAASREPAANAPVVSKQRRFGAAIGCVATQLAQRIAA
ncbi:MULTISPECIES: hypothetical protein [Burkholderia cepacia complex]|uniref:hypothetical protein n=1 Tax=Burkholderia cepacia complex TaxID=87882 RepID=UPI001B9DD1CE|nr:hypothetical protein [Burkholderia cenocepacia]MBR8321233.1 hypothetical protein [Burkholderia cenocepacia]